VFSINDPNSLNTDAGVTSVAISPDGQWVAVGSLDTVVRIWNIDSGQLVKSMRDHGDSVYSVAFMPDGKGLVSGSLDKRMKYWDIRGLYGTGSEDDATGGMGNECTLDFDGHSVSFPSTFSIHSFQTYLPLPSK